jgi:methylmalonyl-CoA mutase N-terminal domain/subunit
VALQGGYYLLAYFPARVQTAQRRQEVAMSAIPEGLPVPFEVITETEVDSRGRVSLGRAGAEPGGNATNLR